MSDGMDQDETLSYSDLIYLPARAKNYVYALDKALDGLNPVLLLYRAI